MGSGAWDKKMVANPGEASFVGFSPRWVWVEPALVWVEDEDASDPALYADYLSQHNLQPVMQDLIDESERLAERDALRWRLGELSRLIGPATLAGGTRPMLRAEDYSKICGLLREGGWSGYGNRWQRPNLGASPTGATGRTMLRALQYERTRAQWTITLISAEHAIRLVRQRWLQHIYRIKEVMRSSGFQKLSALALGEGSARGPGDPGDRAEN